MVVDTENHALLASQSPFVGHPVSTVPPEPSSDEPRMSPFVAIILLYGIMLLIVGAQVCCSTRRRTQQAHTQCWVHHGRQLSPATLVG